MKETKEILKQLEDHEKRIRVLEYLLHSAKKEKAHEKIRAGDSDSLVLAIVNKLGECDESEAIQIKVLDKASMEGKILLCFYISYKYLNNLWLNTGDIEKITSELGVKIDVRNATNKIKELRRYLESGKSRKKGQPTSYRLNRKGVKRFEQIIHAEKA